MHRSRSPQSSTPIVVCLSVASRCWPLRTLPMRSARADCSIGTARREACRLERGAGIQTHSKRWPRPTRSVNERKVKDESRSSCFVPCTANYQALLARVCPSCGGSSWRGFCSCSLLRAESIVSGASRKRWWGLNDSGSSNSDLSTSSGL